jgi:hypothetical protein
MGPRSRLSIVIALAWSLASAAPAAAGPHVTIDGTKFRLDGVVTYPGKSVEGLLLNARMVNAAFDDENPATVGRWAYPDTGKWDPERNTREFIAALPTYAAKGLNAFSLSLQGGNPVPGCSCQATHDWITTAFTREGALKSEWMDRVDRIISAAGRHGIVVILEVTYHGQDQRLADEAAVKRAVDETVDWVLARGHTNVLIEIAAESSHGLTSHAIIKSRVHELIARVQQRSGGKLLASTGFTGGTVPTAAVIAQADYVILHGNGKDETGIRWMIDEVRATSAWQSDPKPIVFTEDSTSLGNFAAAVGHGASWGYHDKGANDYQTGFQTPPVNWGLSTPEKRAFFDRIAQYTGGTAQKTLRFAPGRMSLTVTRGGAVVSRSASLHASDGSSPAYALSDDATWLAASPLTGSAPAGLTITVNPAALAAGRYTGTVTATASGYASATLKVTLTVTAPTCRSRVAYDGGRRAIEERQRRTVTGPVRGNAQGRARRVSTRAASCLP